MNFILMGDPRLIEKYHKSVIKEEGDVGDIVIKHFNEVYKENLAKLKKAKAKYFSPEIFSLGFDALLSDLKQAYWVTVPDNYFKTIKYITQHFKLLE